MTVCHEADTLLMEFKCSVVHAIREIHERMGRRTTIDVLEVILDGVFFRNCHLFEVVSFLIENKYVVGAEYLTRSLFEGTVLLEWCLVDPRDRGLCFLKTVMEGELELTHAGFFEKAEGREGELQDAVSCCEKQLPDFRSMLESLGTYKKDSAYLMYKCLSKDVHGVGSSWRDFLDCSGEKAQVCSISDPSVGRLRHSRSIACFLAMRNVILISSFDASLRYSACADLQAVWERIHILLWMQEQPGAD